MQTLIISSVKASKANVYAFYSLYLSDGKEPFFTTICLVLTG